MSIKSLISGSAHALSVSARAAAGVAVVGTVVSSPLLLGAVIVAAVATPRSDEEKLSDFVRSLCRGGAERGKRGKDNRVWCLKKEGDGWDGYIIFAYGDGSPGQYFRPEQNRTWSRGEAADRAAQLAGFSA
jgi:hypothetical protein